MPLAHGQAGGTDRGNSLEQDARSEVTIVVKKVILDGEELTPATDYANGGTINGTLQADTFETTSSPNHVYIINDSIYGGNALTIGCAANHNITISRPVNAVSINLSGYVKPGVYATDADRDSAITTPTDGMVVYNTAASSLQLYAGAWGNVGGMEAVYCHVDCGDFGNQTPPGTTGPNWQYGNVLVPFSYTVAESTPGIYDYTTQRFTPGVAGVYKVTAVVHVKYTQENGRIVEATLHKNNTLTNATPSASTRIAQGLEQFDNTYTNNYYLGFHMLAYVDTIVSLTSTDWLQLFFFTQNGFGSKASVEKLTKFIIHRIA